MSCIIVAAEPRLLLLRLRSITVRQPKLEGRKLFSYELFLIASLAAFALDRATDFTIRSLTRFGGEKTFFTFSCIAIAEKPAFTFA
jgi:hypothetical protein